MLLRVMLTCSCGTISVCCVTDAEAHRREVAGTVILAGLVEVVRNRGLELTVDEGVEVLADGLIVVGTENDVGGAGPACRLVSRRLSGDGFWALGPELNATGWCPTMPVPSALGPP